MKTETQDKRAVVRDATALDLGRMVKLVEQLIVHEKNLGESLIIDDAAERQSLLTAFLADALFDHDKKIVLIEKSGRILGIFILEVMERPPFHKHSRVCNIWVGYAKKSPIYIKRLDEIFKDWAKEKYCDALCASVMVQNERMRKLMKALGYTETHTTFEKEV